MKRTLLVDAISWLQPDELEELGFFVHSEYHNRGNTREDILRLFYYMKSCYPSFPEASIEKSKVYDYLFPGHPIVGGKIEKLYSELYRIIKSFLLWRRYQSKDNEFDRSIEWAKYLLSVNAVDKFESTLDKIERDFIVEAPLSNKSLLQRFRFETERQAWMGLMNKAKEDPNLERTIISLGLVFEAYRLDYYNQMLLQKHFSKADLSEDVEAILSMEPPVNYFGNPLLRLSKLINKIYSSPSPNEELMFELAESLATHEQQIDPETLKDFYSYLRNTCTVLISYGNEHLAPFLFSLLKDNLSKGYLYRNDGLHMTTLGNITKAAISAGEIDWAIECIESNKNKIIGDLDASDYININLALCYFAKRDFESVLDLLRVSPQNLLYYLIARRLEIMCYYELRSDLLPYKLDAFKVYIWRASEKFLSEYLREGNKAFVNAMLRLISMKSTDTAKKNKLAEKLKAMTRVSELKWLLEKLEE